MDQEIKACFLEANPKVDLIPIQPNKSSCGQDSKNGTPEGSADGSASSQRSRSRGRGEGFFFAYPKGDKCDTWLLGVARALFFKRLGVTILLGDPIKSASSPRCCAKSLKERLRGGSGFTGFMGPFPRRSDPDQSAGLISPDFSGATGRSKDTRARALRARGTMGHRSVMSCGHAVLGDLS